MQISLSPLTAAAIFQQWSGRSHRHFNQVWQHQCAVRSKFCFAYFLEPLSLWLPPELASCVTPRKKCLICSNYAWKTDALMENARWNRFSRVPIQTQFLITRRARRRLKQRQRCRQRKCQKSIKTTPLQVQHTFLVHFFAFSTRLPCENPWSDVLWRTMNFSFSY